MIDSEKAIKLFNKSIEYFITLGFKITEIYFYNYKILFKVSIFIFGIRKRYIIQIYDFNFTIDYFRINNRKFSRNYKIK